MSKTRSRLLYVALVLVCVLFFVGAFVFHTSTLVILAMGLPVLANVVYQRAQRRSEHR